MKTKPSTKTLALTHKSIVPSRARTRSGSWKKTFLKTLTKTVSVTAAAELAGVSRRTAYLHRDKYPHFAEQWKDALEQSVDRLEHKGWVEALNGNERLIEFYLKAHRPQVYRERAEIGVVGGIVLIPAKSDGAE